MRKKKKRWLLRRDGVRQKYVISDKKLKKECVYDKHLRTWVRVGEKEEGQKFLYRNMKVRTYYAEVATGKTPYDTEIADFRVQVVSNAPLSDDEFKELDKALDRMEWIFRSIFFALKHNAVSYRVSGEEKNVKIDEGEEELGFRRSASFYNKYFYDEEDIARIEAKRRKEYAEYREKKRGKR